MFFTTISFVTGTIRPQVILGNMMRPAVPAATFPNPIQRPAVQPASRQPRPQRPQTTPNVAPVQPASSGGQPAPSQSLSDMKLQQRQALLAHTQSFLNPDNKPRVKKNVEVSAKDEKISTSPGLEESKPSEEVSGKK